VPPVQDFRLINAEDGTLAKVFTDFISDGTRPSAKLALAFSAKINEIAQQMAHLPFPLSFLSSSILLLYEGDKSSLATGENPDVRLIDYEKAVWETDLSNTDCIGAREGLVQLARIFEEMGRDLQGTKDIMSFPSEQSKPLVKRRRPRSMSVPTSVYRSRTKIETAQ